MEARRQWMLVSKSETQQVIRLEVPGGWIYYIQHLNLSPTGRLEVVSREHVYVPRPQDDKPIYDQPLSSAELGDTDPIPLRNNRRMSFLPNSGVLACGPNSALIWKDRSISVIFDHEDLVELHALLQSKLYPEKKE